MSIPQVSNSRNICAPLFTIGRDRGALLPMLDIDS